MEKDENGNTIEYHEGQEELTPEQKAERKKKGKTLTTIGIVFIIVGFIGFAASGIVASYGFPFFVPVFWFVCVVGIILLSIGSNYTNSKRIIRNSNLFNGEFLNMLNRAEEKLVGEEKETIVCKYCDSIIDETEKRCPHCGAPLKKDKKS